VTDVVVALSKVSLTFQRTSATLSEINTVINATIQVLQNYKTTPGPYFAKVKNSRELEGFVLQQPITRGQDFNVELNRQKLLDGLITCMKDRFCDMNEGVLMASAITNFKNWPREENSADYAVEAVTAVAEHYETILEDRDFDAGCLQPELVLLKTHVYQRSESLETLQWPDVFRSVHDMS
jgi:hypothetical protein